MGTPRLFGAWPIFPLLSVAVVGTGLVGFGLLAFLIRVGRPACRACVAGNPFFSIAPALVGSALLAGATIRFFRR